MFATQCSRKSTGNRAIDQRIKEVIHIFQGMDKKH